MKASCEPLGNSKSSLPNEVEIGGLVEANKLAPSEDLIRLRAFEIYLERGSNHGQDLDDWFQAKLELEGKIKS